MGRFACSSMHIALILGFLTKPLFHHARKHSKASSYTVRSPDPNLYHLRPIIHHIWLRCAPHRPGRPKSRPVGITDGHLSGGEDVIFPYLKHFYSLPLST